MKNPSKQKPKVIIPQKNIIRLAVVTLLILCIPLVAMQFSDDWDWDLTDFVIVGALLFGTGLVHEYLMRRYRRRKQRLIASAVVLFLFLYVYAELAVGIFTNWGS